MSKYVGRGGTVTKGGVNVANVTTFSFSESEGGAYGQIPSTTSLTVLLEHDTAPLRVADVATYVLTTGGSASWDITLTDARITNADIAVNAGEGVKQNLTITCSTTATIA